MARILIIDDDETLLFALEQALTAAGHRVATASDGASAARLFRIEPFEVVLTDIVMPNREGIETIIELRRDYPKVAVIAMSGAGTDSKLYLGLAARLGAHRTLAKPFALPQLEDALKSVGVVSTPPDQLSG